MTPLRRVLVAAEMQGRDLARRRLALLMLVALPFTFTIALGAEEDFAVVAGSLGLVWAVAGAALFAVIGSRSAEHRLVLMGYEAGELLVGRLLILTLGALGLSAGFGLFFSTRPTVVDTAHVWTGVFLAGFLAVPLGLALAAVLPRELEGTMSLIAIVGVEMTLSPDAALAPFLPLYAPVSYLYASIGRAQVDDLTAIHGVAYLVVMLAIAVVVWTRRLRPTR